MSEQLALVAPATLTIDVEGVPAHRDSWDNEGGPGGAINTGRGLTHSLDHARRG